MILYSNSDSYGVLCRPEDQDSLNDTYSKHISQSINATYYFNKGRCGVSNSRIMRTSIRDLISLRKSNPNKKIQALISLTTTYRSETWCEENKFPEDNDGHFTSFIAGGEFDHNIIEQEEYAKAWLTCYNHEAAQVNLIWQTVMFTKTLQSYDINYLLWWGPKIGVVQPIDYSNSFISDFYSEFKKDKNILSFENFSFCDWCLNRKHIPFDYDTYGNHGHHGPKAHQEFANYLLEEYL